MTWQEWLRGAVMALSLAVIAAVGGPAFVHQLGGSAAPVKRVAMTAPVLTAKPAAAGRKPGADGTPPVLRGLAGATERDETPTMIRLSVATSPIARTSRSRVMLRATLFEMRAAGPVGRAPVTLWRKARTGKWTSVVADQLTGADGVTDFVVSQAGRSAVYRVTFAGAPTFGTATSAPVSVRRR